MDEQPEGPDLEAAHIEYITGDTRMDEAPDKMWVFPKADWFNAGASNVRLASAGANDVEYTRSDIADDLQAEVARLSNTLLTISILEGEYRQSGRIARAALEHKD